jgi:perosamine synthetase
MELIPFAQPNLSGNELEYVSDAIVNGWISGTGSYVSRFEEALAQRVQRKRCIAVANGTLALEVVMQALGIGVGDEVIVPALTFVAPAAAVRRLGATPVLADIDPITWTIDPESVSQCITHNTKAIIGVDLIGNPCDFDALKSFQLPVIEDAAEAHGASYQGKLCGSHGIASTFSFHPNKALTMGEGGAILTDWDLLANNCRTIASHGMNRPYYHQVVGTNARPNNMTCAVGLAQVERWDQHMTERNRVANLYKERLKDIVEVHQQNSTWVVTIVSDRRDLILESLHQNGIDARAIFVPLPELPIYQPYAVLKDYPVARRIGQTALMLPTFETITEAQIDRIAEVIRKTL